MEVLILVGLIILNGVFAMSEIALITAKKSRLTALAEQGRQSAALALRLAEDPTQFLSAVQIGITSIGLLNGIFGEAILAEPFAVWLQTLGIPAASAGILATVLVVIVVTYVSIVAGELVPKRIGQVSAETVACLVARPMLVLTVLTRPFVWMLSGSTHALMRLGGFSQQSADAVTEEDIQAILQEGSSAGVIEDHEHRMVKNVLRLDERSIASLMIPRADIVYLDVALPVVDNLHTMMQSPHSRFPVCRNSLEDVLGIVSAKELLAQVMAGDAVDPERSVRAAHYVPESLTALELLEYLRSTNEQMALVVDEYGDLKGLVTLQDLMNALTGELDPHDDARRIIQREDGSYLLDGLLSTLDLKDVLGMRTLPEEAEGRYQTLNGLLMYQLGRIPQTTDVIRLGDWRLEIVDMDGKRVDKVLAERLPDADADSEVTSPG